MKSKPFLDGRRRYQASICDLEEFPLRGRSICSKDSQRSTARSIRSRKNYYDYYHCSCLYSARFKAEIVNTAMLKEFQKYKPDPALKELYKLTKMYMIKPAIIEIRPSNI